MWPVKELKGFEQVLLAPGEEKEIAIVLDKRSFAFYTTAAGDWQVESGRFEILVGASSADIRLRAQIDVESTAQGVAIPDFSRSAPVYYTGDILDVPAEQYEALLGRTIPPIIKDKSLPVDITDNFENAAHTKWGGRLNRLISWPTHGYSSIFSTFPVSPQKDKGLPG